MVCLVTLFNLTEYQEHQGGSVCGPVAGKILSEVLPYLDVTGNTAIANASQGGSLVQNTDNRSVANVKGMTADAARAKLEESGFNVICRAEDTASSVIVDQMPRGGAYLEIGSTICLYTNENEERPNIAVPDVRGMYWEDAVNLLREINLNVITDGIGTVTAQTIGGGTEVQEGSVITITANINASGGQ